MNRENPRPVPPAHSDLRHLRRHTPGGWLIVHPLVRHPAPKPEPLHSLPDGYTTSRALARNYQLSPRCVRQLCRNLPVRRVSLGGQPVNAYPAAEADKILNRSNIRRARSIAPPPGFLTSAQTCQRLSVRRSSVTRYTQAGLLHPIFGRCRASGAPAYFFAAKEVETLRRRLRAIRSAQISALQAKLS